MTACVCCFIDPKLSCELVEGSVEKVVAEKEFWHQLVEVLHDDLRVGRLLQMSRTEDSLLSETTTAVKEGIKTLCPRKAKRFSIVCHPNKDVERHDACIPTIDDCRDGKMCSDHQEIC